MADLMKRNNIRILGPVDGPVVMFAHGFGCDRGTWDKMLPRFTENHRVVLFDHVGAGGSDMAAYDSVKYAGLDGYARDVLEICEALDLQDVTLVGHSAGGMMALAAAATDPRRLGRLVLLASSPCYMDHPDEGYLGGFTEEDLDALPSPEDAGYGSWAASLSRVLMGTPNTPANASELETSFLRVNPLIAREFSRLCLHADVRHLLPDVKVPSLILHCTDDPVIPDDMGRYLAQNLIASTLVRLRATGHYPHVSSPGESADAILGYLAGAAVPQQVEPELDAAS
jgi:sigma-B regulation protein RsbQ